MLHRGSAVSIEQIKRFRREAHATYALKHPTIVEVQDDDLAAHGSPFIVMELMERAALGESIGRPLELDVALRYLDQCLDGLGAAHRHFLGLPEVDGRSTSYVDLADGLERLRCDPRLSLM